MGNCGLGILVLVPGRVNGIAVSLFDGSGFQSNARNPALRRHWTRQNRPRLFRKRTVAYTAGQTSGPDDALLLPRMHGRTRNYAAAT